MAADWLRIVALDYLMRGDAVPKLPFGNEPIRDGKIVNIAVEASLADVPSVTATEATGFLDVSTACVTQLSKAGALDN